MGYDCVLSEGVDESKGEEKKQEEKIEMACSIVNQKQGTPVVRALDQVDTIPNLNFELLIYFFFRLLIYIPPQLPLHI